MKKTYEVYKKYCIEFEDFANDLWIDDKHNNYGIDLALYDKSNHISLGDETYLVTMVDYQMESLKWCWHTLERESINYWLIK